MKPLSKETRARIVKLSEEGRTCREIAADLGKTGVRVSKSAVANLIASAIDKKGAPASSTKTADIATAAVGDVALLEQLVADTRLDLQRARKANNTRSYTTLARLLVDIVDQLAKLRPPPKIDPDLDPENIRIQQELFAEMDRMAEDFDKERDAEWDALVAEAREHGCPPFIADRIRRRLTWFFDGGVLEPFPPPGIVTSGTPTPELVANYDDEPEPNGGKPEPSNDDSETEEDGEEEPYRPRSMIETRRKGEVGPVTLNKPAGWKREEDMDNWLIPFEGGLGPRDRFP